MRPFIAVCLAALSSPAWADCAAHAVYFACPTRADSLHVRLCAPDPLNAELMIGDLTVTIDLASMRSTLPTDGPETYRAIDFHDPLTDQSYRVWATGLPLGIPEINGGFKITDGDNVIDAATCDPDGRVLDRLDQLFPMIDDAQVSP